MQFKPLYILLRALQVLPKTLRLKTYWIQFGLFVSAMLDVIGLGSMIPVLMLAIDHSFLDKSSKLRFLFAYFNFTSEKSFLIALILFIFLFFVAKNTFAMLIHKKTIAIAAVINETLSTNAFKKSMQTNAYYTSNNNDIGFIDKVMHTPFYFTQGVYLSGLNLFSELALASTLSGLFIFYKPFLVLPLVLFLSICTVGVLFLYKQKTEKLGKAINESREKSIEILDIGPNGLADIKNFQASSFLLKKFMQVYKQYTKQGAMANYLLLSPMRILELITLICIITLVLYAYFVSVNIGEARALAAMFVIAIFRLLPASNRIMQAWLKIKLNAYTLNYLENSTKTETKINKVKFKTIKLENIEIGYEKILVSQSSLIINHSSIIGITGESGLGKTSLIKLFTGDSTIQKQANLLIDEISCHLNELENLSSYMSQQHFCFKGTVAQNIAFNENINENEMQKINSALVQANSNLKPTDFLENKGTNLSEGQLQRLSLARIFYYNKPLIILDEPTSSLDLENEQVIISTIQKLKSQGKACIIIAHKQSIMDICDIIYTIKNKKIIQLK